MNHAMTIDECLKKTSLALAHADIGSAQLDAELLLCHILSCDRIWLHAHSKEALDGQVIDQLTNLVKRRLGREPIAYITSRKEFYGRDFIVTADVLIPRPETEDIIDLVRQYADRGCRALDVGTGSGCIGITVKLEHPDINMTLSDVSDAALLVARQNAVQLGAKPIRYIVSDLLDHWLSHDNPKAFDMIVANLPYVDKTWTTSPETQHEPALALYAEAHGCELIFKLIKQSAGLLDPRGHLIVEADPEQHQSIIEYANQYGFKCAEQRGYAIVLTRR